MGRAVEYRCNRARPKRRGVWKKGTEPNLNRDRGRISNFGGLPAAGNIREAIEGVDRHPKAEL